jgi:ABC-2 type transport system ATP-binding protein
MITLESSPHKKRMIQVNNLSKKYNGTTVLNIENLEIPKGQSLGLVGNNGAVTTFSLLDLIQPSTGSILNNGILVNASEDWKPLQLLLLTKAFDRLFDTGRVLLFHWRLRGQNKADIDALLEKI